MKKYKCGLYVGRFQPIHIGHTSIISKMLDQCEKVIVAVGSAQESGTERTPFSYDFRKEMIEQIYFDRVIVVPIQDRKNPRNDSSWGDYLFSNVYSLCGLIPDVIYEGEEEERINWYDNLDVSVVKVSRSILPISGTALRNAIIWNDKELVLQYLPYAIRESYDDMRNEILKCNS